MKLTIDTTEKTLICEINRQKQVLGLYKYMDRNIYTDIILQGSQEENFRFYFV
jgi:hypothetical protein